jgi:hypothetical protein
MWDRESAAKGEGLSAAADSQSSLTGEAGKGKEKLVREHLNKAYLTLAPYLRHLRSADILRR